VNKRHFVALAEAISGIANKTERRRAAEIVARVCQRFNGQFDMGRFLRACGVN
jgi:hypothetical protein